MKSMTGYGRGESAQDGFKLTAEVSAVNRKQMEIVVGLPRELEPLEPQVREEINRRVSRGRLTVRVSLHLANEKWARRVRLNVPLAKAFANELAALGKELNLPNPVALDTLMRVPGVVETDGATEEAETFWPALQAALAKALAALLRMREKEGVNLAKDLKGHVAAMRKLAASVQKQAPATARRYQQQLLARIRNAGLENISPDDERVLKEVVVFADRADISEELTRLQSHFQQFDDCLKSGEPVGRMLDFLAQEMNREVNTIGSKANDALISRAVVKLKTEVERFREQVQNVE
jgi:uncharacterized protein (TIGR00255 family)